MGHKVVVISDSHGRDSKLRRIVEQEQPFDYLVHCGDGVEDLSHIYIPVQTRVLRVRGNMDRMYANEVQQSIITEICSRRVLITHGDAYGVNSGFTSILREGRRINADIVFFGHTHEAIALENTPVLFNPGPANRGQYGVVMMGQTMTLAHRKA